MAKFMCITLALCAVASASPILPGLEGIPGVNLVSGLTFQGSAASPDLLKGLPFGRSALGVLSNVPVAGGLLDRERRDVDVKLDAGLGLNGGLDFSNSAGLIRNVADNAAKSSKTILNLANAGVNTAISSARSTFNTAVNAARAAAEAAGPAGQVISTGVGVAQGLTNTGLSVLSGLNNAATNLGNFGVDVLNQRINLSTGALADGALADGALADGVLTNAGAAL